MNIKLALCLFVCIFATNAANELNNGQAEVSNDFAQANQQAPVAYDPSFSLDANQGAFQPNAQFPAQQFPAFPSNQRFAGNTPFFGANQQTPQQQPANGPPGQWNGEMADLSQILSQNVVAPQVNQFQNNQPDPLAASPYNSLLKNLAGTAPLYPPILPEGQDQAEEVARNEPQGAPHPPLNVANANYLTAVASIPQRIGAYPAPNPLAAAFPHQTFIPNNGFLNRNQQAPPAFNPWPQNNQAGQRDQQQGQQQVQQQQTQFNAQLFNAAKSSNSNVQQRPVQNAQVPNITPQVQERKKVTQGPVSTRIAIIKEKSNEQGANATLKSSITKQIHDSTIVMYGQSMCQVCDETEKILSTYNAPVTIVLTDAVDNGPEIINILQKETHSKEIPKVFICGHFVGGYRKVQDLHKRKELKNFVKRCFSS